MLPALALVLAFSLAMELAFLLAVVLAISLALVLVFLLPMLVLPMPLLLHLLVLLTTWLFLLVPVLGLGLVPVLTLVVVLFLMAGLEACHPTYQRQTKTIMCGIAGSGQCWGVRKYILCGQQTKTCHIMPNMCKYTAVDQDSRFKVFHVPQHTLYPNKQHIQQPHTYGWTYTYRVGENKTCAQKSPFMLMCGSFNDATVILPHTTHTLKNENTLSRTPTTYHSPPHSHTNTMCRGNMWLKNKTVQRTRIAVTDEPRVRVVKKPTHMQDTRAHTDRSTQSHETHTLFSYMV